MTLCPIAIAIGCRKCPVFKVCPVKGVIGDYKAPAPAPAPARPTTGKRKTAAKKRRR